MKAISEKVILSRRRRNWTGRLLEGAQRAPKTLELDE